MSRDFYIKILKPVPDMFFEDRIFDEKELSQADLCHVNWKGPSDKFHAKIKYSSVYTSMDDMKKYLKVKLSDRKDIDFTSWGYHPLYDGGAYCSGDKWLYEIPKEDMDAMKRPHVAETVVSLCIDSWSVSDWDSEWLSSKCPLYLTGNTIKEILDQYLKHLRAQGLEDLDGMLGDPSLGTGNIFSRLCEATAYAEKIGGIGYLEWE